MLSTTPHCPANKTGSGMNYEMRTLNQRMGSLQTSEDKRLIRELDALELSIQETQRHVDMVCVWIWYAYDSSRC